jgi:hypothetical protein
MLKKLAVLLLALGLLGAVTVPAHAADQPAKAAKKSKKKCKKTKKAKKCKKRKAPAQTPSAPAASGAAGAPPPPPPPPPPPNRLTSEQLIDAAVARGEISSEQGLIYKVYSAFFDPRLPSQYVGVPDPLAEAPLDDVTAQWDQLSDGAKATLGPFLIPPFHQGSYWEQLIGGTTSAATPSAALASPRASEADPTSPWCVGNTDIALEDWHYLEAISGPAAGKVRIWYQDRYASTDAALAGDLLNAMQNKIWPAVTTLMQREPLPDGGSTSSCAGGSDAVDIALVDAGTATTYSHTLSQESTAAQMLFPRTLPGTWAGFKPYLAHEFMHMIQFTFAFSSGDMSSSENFWLKEGTAQWVQDYVSASQYGVGLTPNQTEQQALKYFFPYPEKSLDSTTPGHHDYGSYVFWLWAARKGNDPSVVRQVWNAVATQKSPAAAKSVFGSGWAQAWKDFTKANWNQDPVTDYQGWDTITNTPLVAAEGTLPNNEITPVITTVAPVAAKYLTFTPADDVNSLTYTNIGGLSDDAGVQAIIKYKDGSKATEDWTQVATQDVPFCNIEELTLVLSNASVTANDNRVFSLTWSPPSSGAAQHAAVGPRANVCIPNPQGSFSGTAHYDDTFTTLNYSWSGNVDFDPNGQINPWFPDYQTEVWDNASAASGSVTLSGSGTSEGSDGDCSIDIPAGNYSISPGGGTMAIQPGPQPHYGIQLPFSGFAQATISCPDQDPYTTPFSPPPMMIYTPDPEQTMTRGTYQGSSTLSDPNVSESFSWNLIDP